MPKLHPKILHADLPHFVAFGEALTDFIRTYGESARSTFNFEQQEIVKVTCPKAGTETTQAVTGSTAVIIGTETEDTDPNDSLLPTTTASP